MIAAAECHDQCGGVHGNTKNTSSQLDTCCGPDDSPSTNTTSLNLKDQVEDDCRDACCSGEDPVQDKVSASCCVEKSPAQQCNTSDRNSTPNNKECDSTSVVSCNDSCCSPQNTSAQQSDGKVPSDKAVNFCGSDGCCDTKPVLSKPTEEDIACIGSCCATTSSVSTELDKGSTPNSNVADRKKCEDNCCSGSGSASPYNATINIDGTDCNTKSCCEKAEDNYDSEDEVSEVAPSTQFGQACASHLQVAFRKYTSYLETGRCICRSVLKPVDTCCSKERRAAIMVPKITSNTSERCTPRAPARTVNDTCCTGRKTSPSRRIKRSNDSIVKKEKEPGFSCATKFSDVSPPPPSNQVDIKTHDVENAAAREHVLLNITGMTCTGCANKATNVLERIDGLSNVKINFVTSVGEFDVNQELLPSSDLIISQLARETGFKCVRVLSDHQTLDLMMSRADAKRYWDNAPQGVEVITEVDRKTQRVSYDPTIIGARSVLSSARPALLAPPNNDGALASSRRQLLMMSLSFFIAAICTIPVVVLAWSNNQVPELTRSIVSLVLATIVQGVAVPEFYVPALKSLIFSRIVEMDMLVVISITAAYGYSIVAFALHQTGHELTEDEFFETSSLLITLVLLGRVVAVSARVRAITAVSFKSLQAQTTRLVEGLNNTVELDARLLEFGDTIMIPPHTRIVTDGEVIEGQSEVDESMITGESIPVPKKPGETVVAGTNNGSSQLIMRITRLPGKNSISDIATLVESALGARPRVQELADKFASWLIPCVVTLASITFIAWILVGLKVRNQDAGRSVGTAITYGIAVLAISCPCALGLAVPMVLIVAAGVAAKAGIVIRQATALETAHSITDVVFDKTGTLTIGDLEVAYEHVEESSLGKEKILSITKALIKDNAHPVSMAVAKKLKDVKVPHMDLGRVESIPGHGIRAKFDGLDVRAGNPTWLGIDKHSQISNLTKQGMSLFCVCLAKSQEPLAIWGLKSTLRGEASSVVATLKARGITAHIVSGDNQEVVANVAKAVGIPSANTASKHTPLAKKQYVEKLINQGKKVLFCGDGTNDAVAIAQANIGAQMGSASDVIGAVADAVLLGSLDGIPALLDLSKRAFRRIVFNFVWSAVYNLFAILLASGAFVKVRIPPAYAGLGEIVSVLPVVLVALTLLNYKKVTV